MVVDREPKELKTQPQKTDVYVRFLKSDNYSVFRFINITSKTVAAILLSDDVIA